MKTASVNTQEDSDRRGDAWGRVSYKVSAEIAAHARRVAEVTGLKSETEVVEKALDVGLPYVERCYTKAKAELDALKAQIGATPEPAPLIVKPSQPGESRKFRGAN